MSKTPRKRRTRKKAEEAEPQRIPIDRRMFISVKNGALDEVLAAIADGRDVNMLIDEDRPLHFAVRSGHLHVAEALLEAGADPNVHGSFGCTPLHLAVEWTHLSIVQCLLNSGANLEAQDSKLRNTPLMTSAAYGCPEITRLLIAAGADLSATNIYGQSPYLQAISSGMIEAAEVLATAGADVTARDAEGRAALDLARHTRELAGLSAEEQKVQDPRLAASIDDNVPEDVAKMDRVIEWLVERNPARN